MRHNIRHARLGQRWYEHRMQLALHRLHQARDRHQREYWADQWVRAIVSQQRLDRP